MITAPPNDKIWKQNSHGEYEHGQHKSVMPKSLSLKYLAACEFDSNSDLKVHLKLWNASVLFTPTNGFHLHWFFNLTQHNAMQCNAISFVNGIRWILSALHMDWNLCGWMALLWQHFFSVFILNKCFWTSQSNASILYAYNSMPQNREHKRCSESLPSDAFKVHFLQYLEEPQWHVVTIKVLVFHIQNITSCNRVTLYIIMHLFCALKISIQETWCKNK